MTTGFTYAKLYHIFIVFHFKNSKATEVDDRFYAKKKVMKYRNRKLPDLTNPMTMVELHALSWPSEKNTYP